jgi:hypothetical protein
MDFTQDQVRSLVELPVETLRHWRKAVPYLSVKVGKTARFSFADVIGLAVTRQLVVTFGVQIAVLSPAVDMMFPLLAKLRLADIEETIVTLTAREAKLYDAADLPAGIERQSAILVPLAHIVSQVQQRILPLTTTSSQRALRFPPESARRQA